MTTDNYLYVYLNPDKPGNFVYDTLHFDFEPIYVGIGRGDRAYMHYKKCDTKSADSNKLKINTIKKLKLKYGEELLNYIKFEVTNYSREDVLLLENEYINTIGTKMPITGVPKRGPLTNLLRGGIANPILFGADNPMYQKSFFDVWKEKYSPEEYDSKVAAWLEHNSTKSIGWFDKLSPADQDIIRQKISDKCKGENHYYTKLTKEQKLILAETKRKNIKLYQSRLTQEEKDIILQKSRETLAKTHASAEWIANADLRTSNMKRGQQIYLSKYYASPEMQHVRSEQSKISKLKFKNNTEKYNHFINAISGDNCYFAKSGCSSFYEYMLKRHGKQRADEHHAKLSQLNSGENNGMYGQGHKVSGDKNGRAKHVIFHIPTGEKYYCHGTFKFFRKTMLSGIKPNPIRKCKLNNGSWKGWYMKELDDTSNINLDDYIIFTYTNSNDKKAKINGK